MVQNEKIIGQTADGSLVYDRKNSHIHELGEDLLDQAIGKIYANDRDFIKEVIEFDHDIGKTGNVWIWNDNFIYHAKRKGRQGLTPVAPFSGQESTNMLTVILKKADEPNRYVLISAFAGGSSMPEPWDKNIRTEAEKLACEIYWWRHAIATGTGTNEDLEETIDRKEAVKHRIEEIKNLAGSENGKELLAKAIALLLLEDQKLEDTEKCRVILSLCNGHDEIFPMIMKEVCYGHGRLKRIC